MSLLEKRAGFSTCCTLIPFLIPCLSRPRDVWPTARVLSQPMLQLSGCHSAGLPQAVAVSASVQHSGQVPGEASKPAKALAYQTKRHTFYEPK